MLISVIVPIFNIEKYISQCIESLINQTYKNIEIILVNDGSTDGSAKICNDYKDKDERIKVIHQENQGLSEARNIGTTNSKGDYLMFVDGDDFIKLDAIREIVNILGNNYKYDVLTGKLMYYFSSSEIEVEKFNLSEQVVFKKTGEEVITYYFNNIKTPMWSACRSVYRKDFFLNHNFLFEKNLTSEDLALIPLVYLAATNVAVNDNPFYYYRQQRIDSITNSYKGKKYRDIIKIIDDYEKMLKSSCLSNEFKRIFLKRLANVYVEYASKISLVDPKEFENILILFKKKRYLLIKAVYLKPKFFALILKLFGLELGSKILIFVKFRIKSIEKVFSSY